MYGIKFSDKVYRELSKIPRGTVISYRELAKRVGRPKAIRTVATIVGQNPNPIKVPCYRVIRTDGSLGEYTENLKNGQKRRNNKRKLRLLEEEGVYFIKTLTGIHKLEFGSKSAIL